MAAAESLNDALWEVVFGYTARGVALNKVTAKALMSRAKRPYFLTAIYEETTTGLARFAKRVLQKEKDGDTAIETMFGSLSIPAPPHLVVVLASGAWAQKLDELRSALRKRLPASTVIFGGGAVGVVVATPGRTVEIEDGSTVGLALIRCSEEPTVNVLGVPIQGNPHARVRNSEVTEAPKTGTLGDDADLMIVLVQDVRAGREAIELVDAQRKDASVTGGVLGSGPPRKSILLDAPNFPILPSTTSDEDDMGAVVVALSGFSAASAASRGARVVGPHVYTVDDVVSRRYAVCPGHSVSLDSLAAFRPTAERVHDDTFAPIQDQRTPLAPPTTLHDVVAEEHGLPRPLFLGVKKNDHSSGDTSGFALLNPTSDDDHNLAIDASGVGLDAPLASGDLAAWFTLSAATSRLELRQAAAACRVDLHLDGGRRKELHRGLDVNLSVVGGLVFTCCGRGVNFHGVDLADSSALRHGMDVGLPLIGCFCNGEIGPPPFREFGGGTSSVANSVLSGYTCQATILRLDGQHLGHDDDDATTGE